ncbi:MULTISPECIES: sugar-binding transcriptional regulator [unclassified Rothia (in: high G+C Gram-positive bacteria)]|uniref:sugar-binding transcriptional regulator n=1 Tax=unclassified Rothia (in: high G+C Gram-positive bacteria) TaxID=2689056 RepID=UPI00195C99C5|nr:MULTISPECIES: sugar-binding domain-containing protein [unclassified Rothia (in: high G+C Gram-positive bacteria)]MBM7051570.1 helix-turn-helix domain-containing protein [Rothia sp. ZJ1223]QRZ61838.1 helix-turn-helix domain-containing protein [Rothia sp. ZJ932]
MNDKTLRIIHKINPSTTLRAAMDTNPTDFYNSDHLFAAANMYYTENLSQAEISQRLNVSRPTVSRMLAQAKERGIVQINVIHPDAKSNELLAERLAEALNLHKVYLSPGIQDSTMGPGMENAVLTAIADMKLTHGSTLAVASGLAIYGISHMNLPPLTGVTLIPTVGGVSEPEPWHQPNEIVRTMAQKTGSRHLPIFARVIPTPLMYKALHEDASFQETIAHWKHAQGALVGIGAVTTRRTSIASDIPQGELTDAVGDVCLHFFDEAGNDLPYTGSDRTIRIPLEQLQAIPHSVAIAVGKEKVQSIIAATKLGTFKKLVTDEATAKDILTHLNS